MRAATRVGGTEPDHSGGFSEKLLVLCLGRARQGVRLCSLPHGSCDILALFTIPHPHHEYSKLCQTGLKDVLSLKLFFIKSL